MRKKVNLKIKNYRTNVNIIDNGNLRNRILHTMLFTLGMLALFYVFLLGSMVFNIVERKTLQVYDRSLSSEVGNLELEYLSLSQKIDLDLAYSLGFREIETDFVMRKALGSSGISIAKNEI